MTDQSSAQLKELFDILFDKTTRGEVAWKKSFDESAVEAQFTHNIVRLTRIMTYDENDAEDGYVYTVELADKLGTVVDTIWAHELEVLGSPPTGQKTYWKAFEHLHHIASRHASGADKVVRDLLAELKSK